MSVKYSSKSKIKECEVVLLDDTQFVAAFDQENVLGRDLFDQVCQRVGVAVNNKQYFGLQYVDREDGDLNWLNLDKEIRLRPKRRSKGTLYQFAVKVFPHDPLGLEHITQMQILLQLKVFINRGKFSLSVNKHAEIDGFCVQAALGDFIAKQHRQGYLEDLLGSSFYSPPTGINTEGDINVEQYEAMVRGFHQSHRGMSAEQAISSALEVCKELPSYGVSLHYGGTDQFSGKEVIFCVSRHGIRICQLKSKFPEVGEVCHNFHWRDIISMICDNSKFSMFLTQTRKTKEENILCQVYRFKKGFYGHKAAHRLLLDAENHQKFFFEDDPDRATIIRNLSVEVKSMKRTTRSVRAGPGQYRDSKKNLLARRGMSVK